MKRILLLTLVIATISANAQTIFTPGMSGSATRNGLNNNFTPLYRLYKENDGLLKVNPYSVVRHFMGFRSNGDSIIFNVIRGAALGTENRIIRDFGMALGNGSIVDGYMSTAIGTQTIVSANDAVSMGNESVAGAKLFQSCTLGYNAGTSQNYVKIPAAYGNVSSAFISAVDSVSSGLPYSGRVFWNYPYFFTNKRTKNYPQSASPQGLVRLFCTGATFDGTNTLVYYSDSITSASDVWITGVKILQTAGTANITGGRRCSTVGESAVSFGYNSKSWAPFSFSSGATTAATGQAAASFNSSTIASGVASFAANESNTASGNYSSVFGLTNTITSTGTGSVAFGKEIILNKPYQIGYSSTGKFVRAGDVQAGLFTNSAVNTGAGPVAAIMMRLDFNTTITCRTTYTIVQSGGTVGTVGQSGGGSIDWTIWLGRKYVIDSINLASNRIYYQGTALVVGSKIAMNSYSDATMSTDIASPGGLSYNQSYYIKSSAVDGGQNYVTLAPTSGGTEVNVTSFDNTKYHTFAPVVFVANNQTSFGRSFVNAGDDVGNGTTTGIRAVLETVDYSGLTRYRVQMFGYGLANRTLRFAATNNYIQIATE